MDNITHLYHLWLEKAADDPDLLQELTAMAQAPDRLKDAFYQNLSFGTGGLRGIIGAGTNRMNIYTVARASQGLANYIKKEFTRPEPDTHKVPAAKSAVRIAVSYDSRIKSELFAQTACGVFAANGLEVFLYPQLMPTPCLSFAVRELGCAAGVMITASHNPAVYNGYKVYGADGCQITTQAASDILKEIQKLDMFSDIRKMPYKEGLENGNIQYIPDRVFTAFIQAVKSQSLLPSQASPSLPECRNQEDFKNRLSLVYSPLNGTGLKPVLRVLEEMGYRNISVVEEQRDPDGNFPTCPYPNPEVREAMNLGIGYARRTGADLVLATDPDCDRVGIAARNHDGAYILLTGNETGLLLLDYVCSRRTAMKTMPENPVFMKTIVTTGMAESVAAHYGARTLNVLTGFKFIGEQIGKLEEQGVEDSFIFAFEESYGYLSGSYVRDKDGVVASLLICEMAAWYKHLGISLPEKLEELYQTYGYCLDTQHSYTFEGAEGFARMEEIMERLRRGTEILGKKHVTGILDYREGLDGLPRADVVRFLLEDGCSVVERPSGTEPKPKVYVSVRGESREMAARAEEEIMAGVERVVSI